MSYRTKMALSIWVIKSSAIKGCYMQGLNWDNEFQRKSEPPWTPVMAIVTRRYYIIVIMIQHYTDTVIMDRY